MSYSLESSIPIAKLDWPACVPREFEFSTPTHSDAQYSVGTSKCSYGAQKSSSLSCLITTRVKMTLARAIANGVLVVSNVVGILTSKRSGEGCDIAEPVTNRHGEDVPHGHTSPAEGGHTPARVLKSRPRLDSPPTSQRPPANAARRGRRLILQMVQ